MKVMILETVCRRLVQTMVMPSSLLRQVGFAFWLVL